MKVFKAYKTKDGILSQLEEVDGEQLLFEEKRRCKKRIKVNFSEEHPVTCDRYSEIDDVKTYIARKVSIFLYEEV